MRDIVVFSGSSNPELAERICDKLGVAVGELELKKFANGETSVRLADSVREKDVFIVQSGSGNVNDNLMELLLSISACKMASAKRITVVCPLFFYSRQAESPSSKKGVPSLPVHKKALFDSVPSSPNVIKPVEAKQHPYKSWVAQSGTLIAELLTSAGANHVVTMDLHDPQFQGFFDIPVDNLYSKSIVQEYIRNKIPDYHNCVIVSPDAGGAKRAAAIADSLGIDFALVHKERRERADPSVVRDTRDPNSGPASRNFSSEDLLAKSKDKFVSTTMLVGDVRDRACIIVDDLVDTGSTVSRAAMLLKEQGARYVYALVTHGIFSGDALHKAKRGGVIDKMITTNTVNQTSHINEYSQITGEQLEVLDVSRIFAEAIRRINNGESVSLIYDRNL